MAVLGRPLLPLIWGVITCLSFVAHVYCENRYQSYVVVLKRDSLLSELDKNPSLKNAEKAAAYKQFLVEEHDELLSSFSTEGAGANKIHDYVNVINGFSALLSEDQVEQFKAHGSVKYVLKNRLLRSLSVNSIPFKYMGLQGVPNAVWSKTSGNDVVIGVIDSGILPESPSFNDSGLKPLSNTKAVCQPPLAYGSSFTCNKKLIGARYFYGGYDRIYGDIGGMFRRAGDFLSARDSDGHGTHTASTAAGSIVRNVANFGTLRGVAYNARIMAYKVCWGLGANFGCSTDDIISALDKGVEDGVGVFSISLGSDDMPRFYLDPMSMAMLETTALGIPTVLAGGNSGGMGTVTNSAPWVLTVAASGFPYKDRRGLGSIILKNGKKFKGSPSPDWGSLSKAFYLLINSTAISSSTNITRSLLCYPGSLNPAKAKGKIVVCLRGEIPRVDKSLAVNRAGGIGMVLYNQVDNENLYSDPHSVPSLHVDRESGVSIIQYIRFSSKPTATSYIEFLSIPFITSFSSTGPNRASQYILKPDIAAPGDNVVAAYTNFSSAQIEPLGSYVALSGTSMAAPHVAAAVALIKSIHKTWKPSWLYSAIITSASLNGTKATCIQDSLGSCANPFQMGGGHLDIRRAMDPGLVYDMSADEYKNFLCTETGGYSNFGYQCLYHLREVDFNFPYLSIPDFSGYLVTWRRLTLVGPPALYKVSVQQPPGVMVNVSPLTLEFTTENQTLPYSITVDAWPSPQGSKSSNWANYTFGSITWSDNVRSVKLTLALKFS